MYVEVEISLTVQLKTNIKYLLCITASKIEIQMTIWFVTFMLPLITCVYGERHNSTSY